MSALLLPNLIIGGERRSGTTSLLNYLAPHPQIFMHPKQDKGWFIEDSIRKTPDFSPWNETHKIEDYSNWFVEAGARSSRKIIGEKSADYLFWKPCHQRMAEYLPETKFIFVLRNPAKRAWSHYWNEVAKKREVLSFESALEQESERINISDYQLYNFSYAARGLYSESLSHFFKFIPQDRCLIMPVEQIWQSPQRQMEIIYDFLDIDRIEASGNSRSAYNSNWAVVPKNAFAKGFASLIANTYSAAIDVFLKLAISDRSKRRALGVAYKSPFFVPAKDLKMSDWAQEFLDQKFKDQITDLSDLTGLDFSIWK